MKKMNITKIAEAIANELELHPFTVLKVLDRYNDICMTSEKNTPVFDQEFAYDEAVKNRTHYQLEAIKENIKEKYVEFKTVTRDLDFGLSNESDRINALEGEVEAIKESIGTDIDEMTKVKETVKGLNSIIGKLGEVSDDHDNLFINHSRRFEDVEERLPRLEKGYDSTLTRINNIEQSLGFINSDIKAIVRNIEKIENKFKDWSCKMSSSIEKMEGLQKYVRSFYDGEYNDDFNAMDNRIKKLEEAIRAEKKGESDE